MIVGSIDDAAARRRWALLGGLLRDLAPKREEVLRFTPFSTSTSTAFQREKQSRRTAFSPGVFSPESGGRISPADPGRIFFAPNLLAFPATRRRFHSCRQYAATLFAVAIRSRSGTTRAHEEEAGGAERLLVEARLPRLPARSTAFPFQYADQRILPYPYDPTQARVMVIRLSKSPAPPASQTRGPPARLRDELNSSRTTRHRGGALSEKTSLRAGGGGRYPGYARAQHACSTLVETRSSMALAVRWRGVTIRIRTWPYGNQALLDRGGRRK